ncbi:MAG: NlpC/P60 family protein [Propionibacteriaceae bacterium]|nr:NlpC/P60 family protein [Propionibacteriaceae bacterium]
MNKGLTLIGVAASAAMVVGSVIFAPSAQADVLYPVSATVNVRSDAGTGYAVIGSVAAGTTQHFDCYKSGSVVGNDPYWGHRTNGGYIADYYISAGGLSLKQHGLPQCGATTPAPQPAPAPQPSSWTYSMLASVNVRSGPGTGYGIVGSVGSGSQQSFNCYSSGAYVGSDPVWGHLSNGAGYVSDYYISLGGKTLAQMGVPVCGGSSTTTTTPAPSGNVNSVINSAVNWAVNIANDDTHGYSQTNRQGPDYDCSSFVSNAYSQAGTGVNRADSTYTMTDDYTKHGFIALNFANMSVSDLQKGDVLLVNNNTAQHTLMVASTSPVMLVQAAHDSGNGKTGDQGGEIYVGSYWSDGWQTVLRYVG